MDGRDDMARHERLAEAAYAAMYDARPSEVKACLEDATLEFSRAIEAASRAGLVDEALRLERRLAHVKTVHDHQFRGIG